MATSSATGRGRITVHLSQNAVREAIRRAALCRLGVSTWAKQVIEAALADSRCSHGVSRPTAPTRRGDREDDDAGGGDERVLASDPSGVIHHRVAELSTTLSRVVLD